MRRRDFIRAGVMMGSGALIGRKAMAATRAAATAGRPGISVVEASVADLQQAMESGTLTSRALVRLYLARIRAIDKSGPKLNSILELNPDAPGIAADLDRERKTKGPRGPLHGIPVLIKDNIATAD